MEQNNGVKIQKIYSSAHFIVFSMRFTGITRYIYLGRGKEFEGLFESQSNIDSAYRIQDSFLAYLRSHLRGTVVQDILFDSRDRAIAFHGFQSGLETMFSFFWRGRELFFIFATKDSRNGVIAWDLMCSWKRVKEQSELKNNSDIFTLFDEVGRKELKKRNSTNSCDDVGSYQQFLENADLKFTTKKLRQLKRKEENIKSDIIKFDLWERLFSDVVADKVNLDDSRFDKDGIRIKFNEEQNYFQRKSVLLDKLKKHKIYKELALNRLEETRLLIEKKQQGGLKAFQSTIFNPMTHRNLIVKERKVTAKSDLLEGVRIYSFETGTLGVGVSAHGNDALRNRWGNKTDFWFHLDGDTSPHAVWKSKRNSRPTYDEIVLIGSAIIENSNLSQTEINLIYTEVKNLKSVKNNPGKVIFKKEKRLRVTYDALWQEKYS